MYYADLYDFLRYDLRNLISLWWYVLSVRQLGDIYIIRCVLNGSVDSGLLLLSGVKCTVHRRNFPVFHSSLANTFLMVYHNTVVPKSKPRDANHILGNSLVWAF